MKTLLGRYAVHKYLTGRFLSFIEDRGIPRLLAPLRGFTFEDVASILERELGYALNDRVRIRMVKVLIDFLRECGSVIEEEDRYLWNNGCFVRDGLSADESEVAKEFFRGQVDFFEHCLLHADEFLRGGLPLYSFDNEAAQIWEDFLGNTEFNFARSVLAKVMLSGSDEDARVLDLCYGPGFDILSIQECSSRVRVTALDFKDIFRGRALGRVPNPEAVCWIGSERWGGFGSVLPFPSETFDAVFFACADPYIAEQSRKFVYADIFRVIKSGGSLNILSHCYPDPEARFVENIWVRRGTLCHDFAESVCEGWQGFCSASESVNLFESIGFKVGTVMMNSSIWRLDKP